MTDEQVSILELVEQAKDKTECAAKTLRFNMFNGGEEGLCLEFCIRLKDAERDLCSLAIEMETKFAPETPE